MIVDTDLIRLAAGPLELVLAPSIGGSIARFDFTADDDKISVFRGIEGVPERVLDAASFPLIPYCNRIRDGRFTFRGREVTLPTNMQNDPSPLHGQGWRSPWQPVHVSQSGCEIVFRHAPGDWPWAYEARQQFDLDPEGFTVRLLCRNLSSDPMPCGLGQHPYFPCTAQTVIDTKVTDAWTIDEKVLPVEKVPATGRYDLNPRLCLDRRRSPL